MTSRDALTRAQLRTLGVVWLTYGTFYFCRVNIGPARGEIQSALAVGALEMGLVLGALKIGYAVGQFMNGQLTQRFGPKRVLLSGMFGSALVCVAFAFVGKSVSANVLVALWFLNGVMQAGGWPPCVLIMSRWFSLRQRGFTMGVLGTSYQVGSALTILAVGWIAQSAGAEHWQLVFYVPAAALALSGVHTAMRLKPAPDHGELGDHAHAHAHAHDEKIPIVESMKLTLGNGRLWVLAIGLFGLDLVRFGFLDWAPTHLKEVHGSGVGTASLKAAVFPIAGALGALTSGWATDRFFQSRRAPVIAITLGLVGVLTLAYGQIVSLGAAPTVVCLALIGFFLYGAQILLVGTAAQDMAKRGTTAAAAGFIDFAGAMGAAGGDVITGWLLKTRGWQPAIEAWAGAAILGAIFVATMWNARPRESA
jgi:OPA family glycerol-3-phosphate transporter-like MFS transporter